MRDPQEDPEDRAGKAAEALAKVPAIVWEQLEKTLIFAAERKSYGTLVLTCELVEGHVQTSVCNIEDRRRISRKRA